MTWGRKTGGLKKGTPNKIKKPPALMAEAQAEVAAAVSANEGLQPLDCMLQVMRDPTASVVRPLFFSICYFCLFAGCLATSEGWIANTFESEFSARRGVRLCTSSFCGALASTLDDGSGGFSTRCDTPSNREFS